MIRKILLALSLAFAQLIGRAQKMQDTISQKVNKTDIEIVYNHYLQDGNNSAVTGGVGTEKLTVYGPSLAIKKTKGDNVLSIDLGVDVISSASTDNIDFVTSSASALDARTHLKGSYLRAIGDDGISISGGGGFSIESDYFSLHGLIGIQKNNTSKLRTFGAQFSFFDDDLRWGRLDEDHWSPQFLIYPRELRNQEWLEGFKRNSYNLKLTFSQALDKRNIIGIFPELSYQTGILETPFHRVFFENETTRVEQLPDQRFKVALAGKHNSFVREDFILKNTLNSYADNFGVLSWSIENENVWKLNDFWNLLSTLRFYQQKKARYFKPINEHSVDSEFYTSDFDLSSFRTYTIGVGARYFPFQKFGKKIYFESVVFKYAFLYRSNVLRAHTISIIFTGRIQKDTFESLNF